MNCQGLADTQKRRDVFHYLRSKAFSIYLLQDTHFDSKLEKYICSERGYECYFASHSSRSRGVAVLFNNNFEFKVKKIIKDISGNFILLLVKMMEEDFLIVNVYGPNRDDPDFYIQLEGKIRNIGAENLIMGGDWNLVPNFSLDCFKYKHDNNIKAREQVEHMMINLDVTDIWRDLNPELRRFTWRRSNPVQQSRLDFFLVSDLLSADILDADILPGYRTDHSLIVLSLGSNKEEKHFSLWKFNSLLLKDKIYLEEVNQLILSVKEEYAVLPYARENIEQIADSELQLTISDQLFLDTLLMKIRAKTISYASIKKRERLKLEDMLQKKLGILEQKLLLTEEEKEELENAKLELVNLREIKMKGVMLRSRARWVAEGEKITKYFCSLEKRNYTSKQILKLTKSDGLITTDSKEIAQEVNKFYEGLYFNLREMLRTVKF